MFLQDLFQWCAIFAIPCAGCLSRLRGPRTECERDFWGYSLGLQEVLLVGRKRSDRWSSSPILVVCWDTEWYIQEVCTCRSWQILYSKKICWLKSLDARWWSMIYWRCDSMLVEGPAGATRTMEQILVRQLTLRCRRWFPIFLQNRHGNISLGHWSKGTQRYTLKTI